MRFNNILNYTKKDTNCSILLPTVGDEMHPETAHFPPLTLKGAWEINLTVTYAI